jgi:aminopeptidase YwaD
MKKVMLALAFLPLALFGQDVPFVKSMVDTLCSPTFFGRGYVKDGVNKAGSFLAEQFEQVGLEKIDESYFQYFNFPVNTFPGSMLIKTGEKELKPGFDYMIDPNSGGIAPGKYTWVYIPTNREKLIRLSDSWEKNTILVLPLYQVSDKKEQQALKQLAAGFAQKYTVFIEVDEKFTWSVGDRAWQFPLVYIKKGVLNNWSYAYLDITQKLEPTFESANVIGVIPGTEQPDSFVVFSAHYDHLGGMGNKVYIPGASDNASGTAMLLDMARYYQLNKPKYSVLFIAFAGEEAGLIGSKYFVENPLIPLSSIKFLINMDLMGDASKGITVVNGKVYEKAFIQMLNNNAEKELLGHVKARGKAANSDHYWFSEKGVPAFFIYTQGEITAYHDINDVPSVVTFNKYEAVFELITDFVKSL